MNSENRNRVGYNVELSSFRSTLIIHCPNCNKRSILRNENSQGFLKGSIICSDCGYNKKIDESDYIIYGDGDEIIESRTSCDYNKSNHLKLKFWYSKIYKGKTFWAYNTEHLDFIREFVTSKLRERNMSEIKNRSIGSRLPKWMTSSKNRTDIIKLIAELDTTTANPGPVAMAVLFTVEACFSTFSFF